MKAAYLILGPLEWPHPTFGVATPDRLGEVAVEELDSDGTLAYGRCDAFDGTVADIFNGEDAGETGLEMERRAA